MFAPPPPITLDAAAISGITGSISIACWIIVFTPQLYENFRRQNADGLSMTFVVLWLAGDIFNVIGATLQGVLPTMVILAVYYTLADIILLIQCLVYNKRNNQKIDASHLSPATPLLETTTSVGDDYDTISVDSDSLLTPSQPVAQWKSYLYNFILVIAVFLAGIIGWYFSVKNGIPDERTPEEDLILDPLGQTFGWLCAFLYLGSRLPQILLNFKRQSCEGISFLFFLFACLGNLTYVVSILAWDSSPKYLLVNSSWLAGSVGTLGLDFLIFCQFWIYNGINDESSISESSCSEDET
ncbi:PQ-loop-domain-containing protein [Nadsonia fulvescens var. elongata DSM 6958]|uniref:PQ-loop-domain-containing protein n=1 Tax=Nadsonia fulvescens var. elongata DSM 6958 TaxID=857566 RepID=A0A1E3PNM5_9ASCO|nr:PQ-loop-domain-containing protein [Nadsonia fulvescens var. elongata DSM 6958]